MMSCILWTIVSFALMPYAFLVSTLGSSFFLFVYKKLNETKFSSKAELWKRVNSIFSTLLNWHSYIFHGYEIHGLENIPLDGPAVVIFYHACLPADFSYAVAKIFTQRRRKLIPIVENQAFNIPVLRPLFDFLDAIPGPIQLCVEMLKNGNIIAIAPGGGREMLFSDENYGLLWNNRKGFAKVAIEAKVPIIPVFTQNARQMHFVPKIGKNFFRRIYETNKSSFFLIFGWFPVKLRTFIDKPIEYDPQRSVNELAEMSQQALEYLIKRHQKIPGSILSALKDRFQN